MPKREKIMANIKPFHGVLYNKSKVKNISKVVAPPYDIITAKEQDKLYKANPYNLIRLELGKDFKDDNENKNKYTRAGTTINEWMSSGVLVRDRAPAFYVYKQAYRNGKSKKVRTGIFTLLKFEDSKKAVLPHEKTLAKPKQDRFNLIKEVKANLSPIFGLYDDSKNTVSKIINKSISGKKPYFDVNFGGVNHKLWRMDDKKAVKGIQEFLKDKKVLIADGHHRFEVARNYRDFAKGKADDDSKFNYVLMYVAGINKDNDITIFATHRLLKDIGPLTISEAENKLKDFFTVKYVSGINSLMSSLNKNSKNVCFGIYLDKKYLFISLKNSVNVNKVIDEKKSLAWKKLDVVILHNLVIKNLLSLKDSEDNVKYTRDEKEAVKLVGSKKYGIAFILNPTKVRQVKDVAVEGDMMPQKSTYFYPKLVSGLVINKF